MKSISRILENYQNQFSFYERQYSLIKSQYFTQKDLNKQIQQLKSQIDKKLQVLKQQTQLLEKKRKLFQDRGHFFQNDNFAKIAYIKEIKKPLNPLDQMKQQSQINANMGKDPQIKDQKLTKMDILPNSQMSVGISFMKVEPVLNYFQSQSSQIFPQNFTLHVHHLNNHLSTQLNYDNKNGLHQSGSIIQKANILTEVNRCCRKKFQFSHPPRSSNKISLKYVFRQHNIDLYEQLFRNKQYQSILFSLSDTNDSSGIVVAMAKLSFNEMAFQNNSGNKLSKGQKQKQSPLVNRPQYFVVYFRKMISFNQACPIQQLPLMCKMHIKVQVRVQLLSPPIDQLKDLFYPYDGLKQDKKQNRTNPKYQNQSLSRSPRKIIDKTPERNQKNYGLDLQNSNILAKSPHHKRSYINKLLGQGQDRSQYKKIDEGKQIKQQNQTRNKSVSNYNQIKRTLNKVNQMVKYKKITVIDNIQIVLKLKVLSSSHRIQQIKLFQGQLYKFIENEITPQHVDIREHDNISLANTKIQPIVQFIQRKKQFGCNLEQGEQIYSQSKSLSQYISNFTIKTKLRICLKQKDREGKIVFRLPFLQKLWKMTSNDKKSCQFSKAYQVVVKSNQLFGIEEFQEMRNSQFQVRSSTRKSLQKSVQKASKQAPGYCCSRFKNKIIRLQDNIYVFSQMISSTNITKNHMLLNVQSQFIHQYYFKTTNQYLLSGQPKFYVYPFGTPFKVEKHVAAGFVILFKVNYKQYASYVQSLSALVRTKQSIKQIQQLKNTQRNRQKPSSSSHLQHFTNIQLTISCIVQTYIQQKQVPIVIKQVQFFNCKLFAEPLSLSQYPYIELEVSEHCHFSNLRMNELVKQNQKLTIYSTKKSEVNVVNGQNYILTKDSSDLILQIGEPVKQGKYLLTNLIIQDWKNGKTSMIQLKIKNSLKKKYTDGLQNQGFVQKKQISEAISKNIRLGTKNLTLGIEN